MKAWLLIKLCRLLSVATLLSISLGGCEIRQTDQRVPSSPDVARIQIDRAIRDLGEIPLEKHTEIFEIRNPGRQPLVIRAVQKSCDCVEISLPDSTIPPGESRTLKASISPRLPETRSVGITLHSNNLSSTGRIVLSWKSTGSITVIPETLNFGTVGPGTSSTKKIAIKQDIRRKPQNRTLRVYGIPETVLTAKLSAVSGSQNMVEEIWEIKLTPGQDLPLKNGQIIVSSPLEAFPEAQIPVIWHIQKPIQASPEAVFPGNGNPSTLISCEVEIKSNGDRPLEIERIECEEKNIKVQLEIIETKKNLRRIMVNSILPPRPGSYVEKIQVHCRQPVAITLEIPLTCVVVSEVD